MSLIALILAFLLEHGLTAALRLREPRWLDHYCDWVVRSSAALKSYGLLVAAAIIAVALPAAPVAVASAVIGHRLLGLLPLAFAVVVLLVSFGPRDLRDEVEDYLDALGRGDGDEAARRAKEMLESDAAGRGAGLRDAVEEAIFVQAVNRIFGVMFWFIVLGPAGAWLFRVSDLMRRRAAFEAARQGAPVSADSPGGALAFVHGLLAWIPARLTAGTYALAGSFENAVGSWRVAADQVGEGILGRSEDLLARVGKGSLQSSLSAIAADELDSAAAAGAWRIVSRSVWIWLAVIAMLVLAGSAA
jgi:AmpE protein